MSAKRKSGVPWNTPVNSLGRPWAEGEVWICLACGASGDDRDDCRDMPSPGCPKHSTHPGRGPCKLSFGPPAHAEALASRAS